MSSFDFIVDNIRFSYSSTSTFDTCAYAFKLTYLDALPRQNNFYAEYGTLIHSCFEKYFTGEKEGYELSQYYNDNFDDIVQTTPPSNPPNMWQRYRDEGQIFFDNFAFDKKNYEVLLVEDKIDFEVGGLMFVAKPDLVLKEKSTGKIILYDYKTAAPFRIDKNTGEEKTDTKKINGYHKQMFIYTYALRNIRNIPIDEITLWFTRPDRKVTILWNLAKETEALAWLSGIANRIKNEELFPYNNSNSYFCNELCSVRTFCEYR